MTSTGQPQLLKTGRLHVLDWTRGWASLWVLLYHVSVTVEKPKYFGLEEVSAFTSAGYRGVDLFFLLSGFVMAHVYNSQIGAARMSDAVDFVVRRVCRVFPAFVAVYLALLTSGALFGIGLPEGAEVDVWFFLQNLLLIPRDDLTTFVPVVAWTLTHELMFYTLFLASFVSRRLFMGLLASWAVLGLGAAALEFSLPGWKMVLSPLNAYFLVGVVCHALATRLRPGLGLTWTVAGAVLAAVAITVAVVLEGRLYDDYPPFLSAAQLPYVVGFAALTVTAAAGSWPERMPLDGAMTYLGRVSYGLYLVHYPIVVITTMLWKRVGAFPEWMSPFWPVAVVSVGLSLVAAAVLHRLVEIPGIRLGKQLALRFSGAVR